MSVIISGGAGFIGVNFAKHISKFESEIYIIDNFSNSDPKWLKNLKIYNKVKIINCDLANKENTSKAFDEITEKIKTPPEVWHFAANSNIQRGMEDPSVDLNDTFLTTFNLLDNCKKNKISSFFFASSSAIYGDHGENPLKESTGPLMPISHYGAMKLASEAICFASLESFLSKLRIFRFPNVVGIPSTHGIILDFIKKLKSNPNKLNVLGNGSQRKSYMHIDDLIDGMIYLANKELNEKDIPIFNIGNDSDFVTVKWIAEETVKIISPSAKIIYGESDRGWLGDIPRFSYITEKAKIAGWKPSLNSKAAVKRAIKEIANQVTKNNI